jgi:hypothetical protein
MHGKKMNLYKIGDRVQLSQYGEENLIKYNLIGSFTGELVVSIGTDIFQEEKLRVLATDNSGLSINCNINDGPNWFEPLELFEFEYIDTEIV